MFKNELKKTLAAVLALTMCIPGLTAFADPDEPSVQPGSYSAKEVTAHIFDKEGTKEFTCLFRSDLPEMPYINAEDYMDSIFTVDVEVKKVSDHVYTFSNENGSMTVDTKNETVSFTDYELFTMNDVYITDDDLTDYIIENDVTYAEPDKVEHMVDFDLSKYGFDIAEKDGKVYFPISVLTNLLISSYTTAVYTGGELYIYTASEDDKYVDMASVYTNTMRSEAMADQNYRELCFIMDNFYGCPERVEFAKLIKEKGFDKALDEYSEKSVMAKYLLKKENNSDFIIGLNILDGLLGDGGHTMVSQYPIGELQAHPDLKLAQQCLPRFDDPEDPLAAYITDTSMQGLIMKFYAYHLSRMAFYTEKAELAKQWTYVNEETGAEDEAAALFVYKDTGIFVFSKFNDEAAKAFRESLDMAQENDCKRMIIDLTCNMGGMDSCLRYMMSLIADDGDLPSTTTVTGNKISRTTKSDKNGDGKFDKNDDKVKYDIDFAILASNSSFSCGHVMPLIAKQDGVMLVGTETTGGGSCAVQFNYLSNGYDLRLSSIMKFTDKDGKDTDLGVEPNYVLTKNLTDKDLEGKTMEDLPKVPELFDFDNIISLMDEFYAAGTLGDVSGDGNIDIEDAVQVIGHVNGQKALTAKEEKRADVDGNKSIDIEDAVAIIAHVNGLKPIS